MTKPKLKIWMVIVGIALIYIISTGTFTFSSKAWIETSFGLNIKDVFFAGKGEAVKLIPIDNVFEQGEPFRFVLKDVGKFQKGEDGLNSVGMNIEIKDSRGNLVIVSQIELEHTPDEIINVYSHVTINIPGEYRIKTTVDDKIGGGSTSASMSFTVK